MSTISTSISISLPHLQLPLPLNSLPTPTSTSPTPTPTPTPSPSPRISLSRQTISPPLTLKVTQPSFSRPISSTPRSSLDRSSLERTNPSPRNLIPPSPRFLQVSPRPSLSQEDLSSESTSSSSSPRLSPSPRSTSLATSGLINTIRIYPPEKILITPSPTNKLPSTEEASNAIWITSQLKKDQYQQLRKITNQWAAKAIQFQDETKDGFERRSFFITALKLKSAEERLGKLAAEKYQTRDIYISFPLDKIDTLGQDKISLESLQKEEDLIKGFAITWKSEVEKIIYIQEININPDVINSDVINSDVINSDVIQPSSLIDLRQDIAETSIIKGLANRFFQQDLEGMVIYAIPDKKDFYEEIGFSVSFAADRNDILIYTLSKDRMASLANNLQFPTPKSEVTVITSQKLPILSNQQQEKNNQVSSEEESTCSSCWGWFKKKKVKKNQVVPLPYIKQKD